MQAELSFIDLFLGASFIVQLVMIILFVLAGTSWWFIFDKWLTLSRARKDIYEFETNFWDSKNIEKLRNCYANERLWLSHKSLTYSTIVKPKN